MGGWERCEQPESTALRAKIATRSSKMELGWRQQAAPRPPGALQPLSARHASSQPPHVPARRRCRCPPGRRQWTPGAPLHRTASAVQLNAKPAPGANSSPAAARSAQLAARRGAAPHPPGSCWRRGSIITSGPSPSGCSAWGGSLQHYHHSRAPSWARSLCTQGVAASACVMHHVAAAPAPPGGAPESPAGQHVRVHPGIQRGLRDGAGSGAQNVAPLGGATSTKHWAPIVSLCRTCLLMKPAPSSLSATFVAGGSRGLQGVAVGCRGAVALW